MRPLGLRLGEKLNYRRKLRRLGNDGDWKKTLRGNIPLQSIPIKPRSLIVEGDSANC